MNAQDLLSRAGCLALGWIRRAGIDEGYWSQMLVRNTPLKTARTPDRLARLIEQAEKDYADLGALIKDMKKADRL